MKREPLAPALLGSADDAFEWEGASGRLLVRMYRGSAKRSSALVVFFPPGGFVTVDLDAADSCMKTFAEMAGATVLAPTYAVAPEHPFPAAPEDAHAVLRQAAARPPRKLGWTGEHLFVGGIEAGGNLAAVATLMCRDRLGPKLAGQILVMPMLDPSLTTCSMRESAGKPATDASVQAMSEAYRDYLPRAADRVHPYACPLQSSRLAGLPPTLMIYAEGDALADEARTYADKLQAAGVPVHRLVLPPRLLTDTDERCAAAGDDPAMRAVQDFLMPYLHPTPAPTSASAATPVCDAPSLSTAATSSAGRPQ